MLNKLDTYLSITSLLRYRPFRHSWVIHIDIMDELEANKLADEAMAIRGVEAVSANLGDYHAEIDLYCTRKRAVKIMEKLRPVWYGYLSPADDLEDVVI